MFLKNHIAYRFLTDDSIALEMVEASYPKEFNLLSQDKSLDDEGMSKVRTLYTLLNKVDQKAFYVTDTVLDKLEMLKIKKMYTGQYDWSVFSSIKNLKYTFVLPPIPEKKGGGCLRFMVNNNILEFAHISFQFEKDSKEVGNLYWVMFYVDRITNQQCEHFSHQDVKSIEEFVYKLLCFVFLSENYEETIKPGEKKGTRKQGKIINILPIPLTIINSKWNVTSVRTEGFDVSGHFRLQPTSAGTKMIFINPFRKHGYIRTSKKELINN